LFTYYKQGSSFDYKAASLYSASIHCDGSTWTFAYADTSSGEILAIEQHDTVEKDPTKGLSQILLNSELKNHLQSASKTAFYSTSKEFTIIPSVFFDKQKLLSIGASFFENNDSLDVTDQFIPEIDSYLVFGISKNIQSSLIEKIGHIDFSHHFSSLISTYSLFYTKEGIHSAFIQYHQNKFTLSLFNGKNMIHFNSFEYNSPEDVLYYTYYTMDQFNFSASETAIHVGGAAKESELILNQLQKYSKNIYQLKPKCCPDLATDKSNALLNTIFDVQCG